MLRQNTSIGARDHWAEDVFVHDLIDMAGPVSFAEVFKTHESRALMCLAEEVRCGMWQAGIRLGAES